MRPGSYQFKDADGRVIYVGKAKSLRQRLSNYFQTPATCTVRTAQMVATAETVEWIQVRNEVEALMLEYNLIKQHRPRFNVRLVDDKSYPYLAVTVGDEWPRAMVMRGAAQGHPLLRARTPTPTPSARRSTCCCARSRSAPAPTQVPEPRAARRPCLLFHIEKCSGPAWARSPPELRRDWSPSCSSSSTATPTRGEAPRGGMREAAAELEFERPPACATASPR
jgi:excinuclease ABC subunit C